MNLKIKIFTHSQLKLFIRNKNDSTTSSIELVIIRILTPKPSIAAANAENLMDTKVDTDTKALSYYHAFQEYQSKLLIQKNTKGT